VTHYSDETRTQTPNKRKERLSEASIGEDGLEQLGPIARIKHHDPQGSPGRYDFIGVDWSQSHHSAGLVSLTRNAKQM